jgi:adenosylhomocysteine nucleosidase
VKLSLTRRIIRELFGIKDVDSSTPPPSPRIPRVGLPRRILAESLGLTLYEHEESARTNEPIRDHATFRGPTSRRTTAGERYETNTNVGAFATNGGVVHVGGNAVGVQHTYTSAPATHRQSGTRRADIGILTVLTEELRAVVDTLHNHIGYRTEQQPGGWQTFHAKVAADDRDLRVVATQTLDRGPRSAAVAFDRLQNAFGVPLVLLVGIAGAVRADVEIGDVVIADEVIYYDTRHETEHGSRRRGQSQPMSPAVRHRVNEFFRRYPDGVPRPGGGSVRVVRGPIGSGDAVVTGANSDIVDFLRQFNEKTVALETEAGGVGQAFYEHIDNDTALRGWLTIRGISDHADAAKGHDRHQLAADNAALVSCVGIS